jgi:anti-sigma-K factor RskA
MARDKDTTDMPSPASDAAEYVLGVMTAAERQAFAQRLSNDAALRAEVVYWENRLATLADDAAPVAPPASVYAAVEKRLFAETAPQKPGLLQSLGFWRGLSFASIAAAVALSAMLLTQPRGGGETAGTLIAELAGESKAVRLAVAYDASAGALNINRVEGAAASGRVFELWLIEGGNAPVSLGVLPADARGTVVVPEQLRAKLPNAVLAISDEPTGGSPTGAPTGAVLATGQVLTVS